MKEARQLRIYERRLSKAMRFYWEMIEGFYTTPFMEVFMEPRSKFQLVDAITAVLAGEVEGGWPMWWRLRMFFWIVKLQSRWPFLPRISFN